MASTARTRSCSSGIRDDLSRGQAFGVVAIRKAALDAPATPLVAVNHACVLVSTVVIDIYCRNVHRGQMGTLVWRQPATGARGARAVGHRCGPGGRDLGGLPQQARERRRQAPLAERAPPAERGAHGAVRGPHAIVGLSSARRVVRPGRPRPSARRCSPISRTTSVTSCSSTSPGTEPDSDPAAAPSEHWERFLARAPGRRSGATMVAQREDRPGTWPGRSVPRCRGTGRAQRTRRPRAGLRRSRARDRRAPASPIWVVT